MRVAQTLAEWAQWRWMPCVGIVSGATLYALLMAAVIPDRLGSGDFTPPTNAALTFPDGEDRQPNFAATTRPPPERPTVARGGVTPRPTFAPPSQALIAPPPPPMMEERAPEPEPPPPPPPPEPPPPPQPEEVQEEEEELEEIPPEEPMPDQVPGIRRQGLSGPLRMLPAPILRPAVPERE